MNKTAGKNDIRSLYGNIISFHILTMLLKSLNCMRMAALRVSIEHGRFFLVMVGHLGQNNGSLENDVR